MDERDAHIEQVGPSEVASEASSDQVLLHETSDVEQRSIADEDAAGPDEAATSEPDLKDNLQRLQAEFDNFRKRSRTEQASLGTRAVGRFVEKLLPVLDNFELAIAHGEGGSGVQLVFKELTEALRSEGLEETPGEGAPFDPRVHDAVESVEREGLEGPIVQAVYRRGYTLKDQLIRPAMVVVARPAEPNEDLEG